MKATTVDEYIAAADLSVKPHLELMRSTIRQAIPQAEELISYDMPAYRQSGMIAYFGGFKKHVSLFPGAKVIEGLGEELADYQTSKGTIRFPLDKSLPVALIAKIVKLRLDENLKKSR